MKKIFISIAAIAALVSCVEEKGLEPQPQQPVGNQVTIKAVAAETKTVLDGTDVVWEDGDAIDVVFSGSGKTFISEFTTTLDQNASKADFIGTVNQEATVAECDETGYAVYPAGIIDDSYNPVRIDFTVPVEQDGIVDSKENLSYAEVSLADIRTDGRADVTFKNSLSMLRLTVPEGVNKVTITSEAVLAGQVHYTFGNGQLIIKDYRTDENKPDENKSVVLVNEDNSELSSSKIHDILVLPGEHESLTIKLEGTDVSYEKTLDKKTIFEPSQYYNLNMNNIFGLSTKEYKVSPFEGSVLEIPFVTTADNFSVLIPDDAKSWLSETPNAKSGLRKGVISLTVQGENSTGNHRSAEVAVNYGNTEIAKFTVSQNNFVTDLIGDYIERYNTGYSEVTGKMKIEKSDDITKGVYKVTICSKTLYADYAEGTLTCYEGSKSREITVTKKNDGYHFSATGGIAATYSAFPAQGEAELTTEEQALIGFYDESWKHGENKVTSQKGMEISVSDEAAFGQLKVKFLSVDGSYFEGYAALDGTTLNVQIGGQAHSKYDSPQWMSDVVIPLSVNQDGTITLTGDNSLYGLSNYMATRNTDAGGDNVITTEADLVGTWSVTCEKADIITYYPTVSYGEFTQSTGTATIEYIEDRDVYELTNFMGGSLDYYPSMNYRSVVRFENGSVILSQATASSYLPDMTFVLQEDNSYYCEIEFEYQGAKLRNIYLKKN